MIPFRNTGLPESVTDDIMEEVYQKLKTPYKTGAVCIRESEFTDSPSVFKLDDKWYMMYLVISNDCATSGYSTWLSVSDDLVHWQDIGPVMERNNRNHWDSKQVAGYIGLPDIGFEGSNTLSTVNGSYLVSYLGGNSDGYEPAPLYMGLATASDLKNGDSYVRKEKPVLSPNDDDCRTQETKALFRSFIFKDEKQMAGFPYLMVYNAKDESLVERIFLAVSEDALHWQRYGDGPVLDGRLDNPNNKIVADAQIIEMDGLYVMVYFNFDYDKSAYSTFACSYDMVHWTAWKGKPLVESEYPFEDEHAHKSWIVRHKGVTYNFYCAVNSRNQRFIALAASEPFNSNQHKE